ncbi:hypothetical protein [Fibrella aquatilis]|uniref:Uncharacterized protein n=1 Tax=Fibrella aquatilis TaxID=2817059 RepID=A0A939G8A8_9BACT|nr:hypothetical protein [Fibrella aquatilis]MBO0934054.1 hypothetical protein [Fibrella aquatilis]
MKPTFTLFTLSVVLWACQSRKNSPQEAQKPKIPASVPDAPVDKPQESPDNFVIIPGQQAGPVRANSTEASLKSLYGAKLVVRDTVYMGEGEFEIGTTVFKNTADQIQILWKDKQAFARPEIVFIRPAYDDNNQLRPGTAGKEIQWTIRSSDSPTDSTPDFIKIGTTLRDVEKANGKPFKLYGFGWDYGGTTAGWEGGKLQAADKKSYLSLIFGFDAAFYEAENKLYDTVMGDSEFLSNNPAMQQLNPTVQTLSVSFR